MRILLAVLAIALVAPGVSIASVTIDWVQIGNAGNGPDDTGYGSVGYSYWIGKYEVTNAEYAEFLNAVATTDPGTGTRMLYSGQMGTYGIVRTGSQGSYTYTLTPGREDEPIRFVCLYDTMRFANWMHNGQPTGLQDATTTEDGAYTITEQGITDNSITRNAGGTVFVASEDEWYKAAYYSGAGGYFDYPAGANTQTACAAPTGAANTANCNSAVGTAVDVGSYPGSPSPYGTFDQGGNVREWTDTIYGEYRVVRGGYWGGQGFRLAASYSTVGAPTGSENQHGGFRVVTVSDPQPPIPSLSPWLQAVLPIGLIGVGAVAMRRRFRKLV